MKKIKQNKKEFFSKKVFTINNIHLHTYIYKTTLNIIFIITSILNNISILI